MAKMGTCAWPLWVLSAQCLPLEIFSAGGDTVIHHVDLSLFPNWVGVEQERLVEVLGNRWVLSTRPILLGGVQRTAHLIWEVVGKSEQ